MAAHDEGTVTGPAESGRKRKVTPARNAIGVLLLASFSAIAYVEWDANRRSNAGISRLNQALANEEGGLLSMEQVEGLLGRKPDGPGVAEGGERKVTYTWRGVLRNYRLVAVYVGKDRPGLLRTE